jgi:hypothetical protein
LPDSFKGFFGTLFLVSRRESGPAGIPTGPRRARHYAITTGAFLVAWEENSCNSSSLKCGLSSQMTAPPAESEQLAVVFLGSFNPKIFQPEWFARHSLVTDEESLAAKVTIVSEQVTDIAIQEISIKCIYNRLSGRNFECNAVRHGL